MVKYSKNNILQMQQLKAVAASCEKSDKKYYEMPAFVGFQTFDAVGVFGLAFNLLFKSCST